jgi:predicted MFS family arabinose efflux permease
VARAPVTLCAAAAGVAIANNYYVQPLLPAISSAFRLHPGAAGLLVTVSQVGYLVGLALIVPLGDIVSRRRLLLVLMAASTLGLGVAAAAPSAPWFAVALAAFGCSTVFAQVLVSLVADLSDPGNRGRNVGRVMAGLLLGVLLARTLAGALAQIGGWRTVYWTAVAGMALTGVAAWRRLPPEAPREEQGYVNALVTTARLMRREPVVQVRALYGALTFGAFSVLWSTLALMLARSPYRYSEGTIGLFGLAAAMGAAAALFGGRLFDRGHGESMTAAGLLVGLVGFAALEAGEVAILAVIAGVLLVDFGGQLVQVASQGSIYSLRDGIRGRVTTAYMGTRFVGGVVGSALGIAAYAKSGWQAAAALGGAMYGLALLVWACHWHTRRMAGRQVKVAR